MTDVRRNVAVWFEIPASDFQRASGFYEAIFSTKLDRMEYGGRAMGVFPHEAGQVTGAVTEMPARAGGDEGTVVFFNCDGRLDDIAQRVEAAGGRLLTPRVDLPNDMGSFYQIADTECNRVGLHAVA